MLPLRILYFTRILCCVRNLLSRHVWHSWRGAVLPLWVVWPQTRTSPKAPSCPQRPWPPCWPACSPVLGERLSGLVFITVLLFCLVFKLNQMSNVSLAQSEAQLWLYLIVFWPYKTENHTYHPSMQCYLFVTWFVSLLFLRSVSQELSETILTMVANCSNVMNKARQPPPGVMPKGRAPSTSSLDAISPVQVFAGKLWNTFSYLRFVSTKSTCIATPA